MRPDDATNLDDRLNPPDLVKRVPEVVPGYADRIPPVGERAAKILKKRTLSNLYNERPTWLANALREPDEAVAAALRLARRPERRRGSG